MKITLVLDDDGPELLRSALEAELVFWRSVASGGKVPHAREKCVDVVGILDQLERQLEARGDGR